MQEPVRATRENTRRIRMSTSKLYTYTAFTVMLLAASLFVVSCDHDKPSKSTVNQANAPASGNPDGTLEHDLRISPKSTQLRRIGETANFKVDGGVGPYTWSLASPSLGTLTVIGYSEAMYTATTVGENEVICTDRKGHRIIALVNGLPLSVTPASASVTSTNGVDFSGATVGLNAQDGAPPYVWTLNTPTMGTLVDLGGGNATYTPTPGFFGSAQIVVSDQQGDSVVIAVTQEDNSGS